MLYPQQLAGMRLGVSAHPEAQICAVAGLDLDQEAYSFGRVPDVQRVDGDNANKPDCVPTAYCNALQSAKGIAGDFSPIINDVPVGLLKIFDPSMQEGMSAEDMWNWGLHNSIWGWRLKAWRRIDHTNEAAVRASVRARGFVPITVALATDQQNQRVWTPTAPPGGKPGSWGLHETGVDQYFGSDSSGTSWGEEIGITRAYFADYVLAAYDLEWIKA